MTTIRLAWVTTARSGLSGTVTFTPTRRYWREDTRVADEAASVTVTVPEQPGTATVDLDPTGEAWCYAVTWAPDGPLATEWTEYVTVPVPPAGDPLGAIPYRDLLKLTRDAAAVLTGEHALTAATALARVETAGADVVDASHAAVTAAEAAGADATRAASAASTADAAAEVAVVQAERATSAADTLNADAAEFGDRVRSGEFQGDPGVIAVPAPGLPGVLEVVRADGSVTPAEAKEDARATVAAASEVERMTADAAAHSSTAAIAAGWAERVTAAAAAHAEAVLEAVVAAVGDLRALLPDGGGTGLVMVPRAPGVVAAASGVGLSSLTRSAPGVVTLSTLSPDVTSSTRGVVTITNGA